MILRVAAAVLTAAALAPAQRTLEYDRTVVSQVRIDARDLGYPPLDVIPAGESAIAALAVAPSGIIYGATSGKRSHLFTLDPRHGYVQPLGRLRDVTAVPGTLAFGSNGDVYIGGSIPVDNGGAGYATYAGGHLLRYAPFAQDSGKPIRIEADCPVTDLGIPVPHESIYALTTAPSGTTLYGITYPSGNFFVYDIGSGRSDVIGKIAEHLIRGEKFEKDRLLGRALIVARNGAVFTSGEDGALFRFTPELHKVEKLPIKLPSVPGREGFNRVDAWAASDMGVLYGGTSDGYLFRLRPESIAVENLGKPLIQYRIRGLVFAPNGKLYGAGGDNDDLAHLFSYDPRTGAYEVLGFIDVNRRPYYSWQAYQIGAIAAGLDGTIYLGQSERKSRLYLYYPVP